MHIYIYIYIYIYILYTHMAIGEILQICLIIFKIIKNKCLPLLVFWTMLQKAQLFCC